MKNLRSLLQKWALVWAFTIFLNLIPAQAAETPLPPLLQKGFALWQKGGADIALDFWQKTGLMENERARNLELGLYIKNLDRALGNFASAEWVDEKWIGKSTQIVYVGIHFDRGILFGKFLLYQAGANWVVQDMVFATRPEAVMPWLATEGNKSAP